MIPGLLPQSTLQRIAKQILKTMEATDLPTRDRLRLLDRLERIRQDIARAKLIREDQQVERLLNRNSQKTAHSE